MRGSPSRSPRQSWDRTSRVFNYSALVLGEELEDSEEGQSPSWAVDRTPSLSVDVPSLNRSSAHPGRVTLAKHTTTLDRTCPTHTAQASIPHRQHSQSTPGECGWGCRGAPHPSRAPGQLFPPRPATPIPGHPLSLHGPVPR